MANNSKASDGGLSVEPRRYNRRRGLFRLRVLGIAAMAMCLAFLLRALVVEAYHVPTGSMAPALVGGHRACKCPRCGYPVRVGLHERDDGRAAAKQSWYRHAWCPNCGQTGLPLHESPMVAGQRVLVNKAAFNYRAPRRWEIAALRLFGLDFIKRILGLPGESVEIKEGDLFIDGALCRKTLAQFKSMRIELFTNNHLPGSGDWTPRWESAPFRPTVQSVDKGTLILDGTAAADGLHLIAYRHFCLDTNKLLTVTNEFSYNGAYPPPTTPVHDVMLECDIEIQKGQGELALGITDGRDHILARIPIENAPALGHTPAATVCSVDSWSLASIRAPVTLLAEAGGVSLRAGRSYYVEWGMVDRRIMLFIDGVPAFAAVDLPACGPRDPMVRPVMLAALEVKAAISNIRLWRDVHYTQDGLNGVRGAVVRLAEGQYFVLGDNSSRSEDSRFWPESGVVPADALIGAPLFPARTD